MPTSERDVLELMNRAAMNPPQMHLSTPEVLASARARRRSRRVSASSMALAAVVLAAVAWVGLGSGLDDVLGEDVQPAERIEWDDSIAFEAELPSDDSSWQGFVGASLSREAGAANFVVDFVDGEDVVQLEADPGDLPDGVAIFTNNGSSLIVSEDSYDGSPFLDLTGAEELGPVTQTEVADSGMSAHVWVFSGGIKTSTLLDIYWLLPDQVATSRGADVINEVIDADGEEIPIMIDASNGRWAERSWEGMQKISAAGEAIDGGGRELMAWTRDDVVFAVLPADARAPLFRVSGSVSDSGTEQVVIDKEVQASSRFVGAYQLVWGVRDQSDFRSDGFAYVEAQGLSPDEVTDDGFAKVTALPDGGFEFGLPNGQASLTVQDLKDEFVLVDAAADGSAIGVGTPPEVPQESGGDTSLPPGMEGVLFADLVLDGPSGPQLASEVATQGALSESVPQVPGTMVVTYPRGSFNETTPDFLPTLLYSAGTGPQWAGEPVATKVTVGMHELEISVDDARGLWAAGCEGRGPVVGRTGSAGPGFLACDTPELGTEDAAGLYAVLVLPLDVVETATPIPHGLGLEPGSVRLGDPEWTDLGGGLSLWVVPMYGDFPEDPAGRGIDGIDLDGDGVAD